MKQTVPGQDAEIVVNGTKIKRSTNSIADALQGVTLDLKTTTKPGEPQNLVIGIDKSGSADKIKEWVDNYNSLLDTFNSLTKYTPVKSGEAQNAKTARCWATTPCAASSPRSRAPSVRHRTTRS